MTDNILPASAVPFTNVYTVDVTPELAESWLAGTDVCRPVLNRHVEKFAAEMTAGRWRLTHQGIAFDTEGKLIDGRHRLLAVIRSGATVPMLVVVDEPVPTNSTV